MMRARASLLLAAAFAAGIAATPARAGIERAGTTAANFLAIGSNPAVLGMAGAGLSLEGGLAAFDWNPATLAGFGRTEAMFSHAALGDQTAQEWAGFGSRLHFAGLSGAVTGLFQNEGSFDGRDALGNPTGTFDVSSVAMSAGLARTIGPFMTGGIGLKYASENLGGVRGSGVALDAGLQVRAAGFGFGAAAQNVLGRMKYGSASYDFPANYGIGFSYQQPSVTGLRVALDMNFPAAYYSDIRAGLEWRWNDRFALRTGYRAELGAASGEPMAGPTFGMGAGARGMWFDYGFLVGGTGTGQHRIGITFHPGAFGLSPEGPEHRDGYGHASTPAPPEDAKVSQKPKTAAAPPEETRASEKPKTVESPAPSSAHAPATGASNPAAGRTAPAGASQGTATTATPATAATPGPRASAPTPKPVPAAVPGAAAAGPMAAQVGPAVAPPSYAQRAKSARGTGEAAAADRKSAALEPASGATPKPVPASAPVAAAKAAPAQPSPRTSAPGAAPASAPATAPASAPAASPAPAPPAAAQTAPARPDTASKAAATEPGPKPGPRPDKVRVKSGQTMAEIARTYGVSVASIMMENDMVTDRVRPGQVLKLPRK
jgi:LysM repeat protein